MSFELRDYQFELPPELIAQFPATRRSDSRLLVVGTDDERDRRFADLPELLRAGDVLVLNQTRVIPARCHAVKSTGTRIEVFFLGVPDDPLRCEVLLKPARRVRAGMALIFPVSGIEVRVARKLDAGRALLDCGDRMAIQAILDADGEIPLPPYIDREADRDFPDAERYQTVFAKQPGAVAAPTAGLHFTQELIKDLERHSVEVCYITHHVGAGTFRPVATDDIRQHDMDAERYSITPDVTDRLNRARAEGRRVIAVGTTSTRCLESAIDGDVFCPGDAMTDLFIYPGYSFRAIDGLITNFHLPGSSLILLVAALMGRERVLAVYREAITRKYRFYSYGDAMLFIREAP